MVKKEDAGIEERQDEQYCMPPEHGDKFNVTLREAVASRGNVKAKADDVDMTAQAFSLEMRFINNVMKLKSSPKFRQFNCPAGIAVLPTSRSC